MRVPKIPEYERSGLTSLVDIAFLILIFFMALPLKRLDGKIQMQLPKDHGMSEARAEPPPKVLLRIDQEEGHPAYHLGSHRASRARDLIPVLENLGPAQVYELDASPDVEYQSVVSMLDVLLLLDFPRVQFTGRRGGPGARR